MVKLKLSGKIDLRDIAKVDPDFPLKVAVTRNCRVINWEYAKVQSSGKTATFSVAFDPGTKKATGVNLVIAPDVPDERIKSVEHQSVRVPSSKFKNGAAEVEFSITDRLYRIWRGICRTYKLRGRVVCRQLRWDQIEQQFVPCEAPVPGAKVTAKDVDRLWWWCRKDVVGSDYTDLNGNFEIEFRWCCWWWGPWWRRGWQLDPNIVDRIKDLARASSPVIPLPPPRPELDLRVFEDITSEIEIAQSFAPGTEALVASPHRVTDLGRQVAARLPEAPDLRALHIWPWWPHVDCKPDIIFEVTQDCGDGEKLIVDESCSDTRWNVPTELSGIVLVANEDACCPPCCTQPPDDDCLVFQGVGCGGFPITAIEQNMASPLVGYAQPGTNDRPFARTIRLRGMFGDGSTVDYYKVQSRRYLETPPGGPGWDSWVDIPEAQLQNFNRHHWLGFPPPFWLKQEVKPKNIDGEIVLKTTRRFREENPPIVDSVDPIADDWIALWKTATRVTLPSGDVTESPILPDGLYELRVIGYDYDVEADTLENPRVMPLCPAEDDPVDPAMHATMKLRLDNRNALSRAGTVHVETEEPEADFPNICAVIKNEGGPDEECVSVCGVLSVVAGDTITVRFRASDSDGHLERYTLNAHWAESDVFSLLSVGTPMSDPAAANPGALVGPRYADTFSPAQMAVRQPAPPPADPVIPRPVWHGGDYKVTVTVDDPVPGLRHRVFETCCAYLLRLKVWKRTTDGCAASQHLHRNWAEFSFTIVRADLPCGDTIVSAKDE